QPLFQVFLYVLPPTSTCSYTRQRNRRKIQAYYQEGILFPAVFQLVFEYPLTTCIYRQILWRRNPQAPRRQYYWQIQLRSQGWRRPEQLHSLTMLLTTAYILQGS